MSFTWVPDDLVLTTGTGKRVPTATFAFLSEVDSQTFRSC